MAVTRVALNKVGPSHQTTTTNTDQTNPCLEYILVTTITGRVGTIMGKNWGLNCKCKRQRGKCYIVIGYQGALYYIDFQNQGGGPLSYFRRNP